MANNTNNNWQDEFSTFLRKEWACGECGLPEEIDIRNFISNLLTEHDKQLIKLMETTKSHGRIDMPDVYVAIHNQAVDMCIELIKDKHE